MAVGAARQTREISLSYVFYRLFLSRRILLASLALHLFGIGAAWAISGGQSAVATPIMAASILVGWTGLAAFALCHRATGQMDPIIFGLADSIFLGAFPAVEWLVAQKPTEPELGHLILLGMLLFFGWLSLIAGLLRALPVALKFHRPVTVRYRRTVKVSAGAQELFELMAISPGRQNELRTTGLPDDKGWFDLHGASCRSSDPSPHPGRPCCRAFVHADDGLSATTATVAVGDDALARQSTQRLDVRPTSSGQCIVSTDAVAEFQNRWAYWVYWLCDFERDQVQRALNVIRPGTPPAIRR